MAEPPREGLAVFPNVSADQRQPLAVCCTGLLGDTQWFDASHVVLQGSLSIPQVDCAL